MHVLYVSTGIYMIHIDEIYPRGIAFFVVCREFRVNSSRKFIPEGARSCFLACVET